MAKKFCSQAAPSPFVRDQNLLAAVSEVLEPGERFDRSSDAAADQDLLVLGLGTKPGGEVAYRADREARPFGKADLA